MRVLVTGSTGQQGGAVTRELLAYGHTVRALTRDIGAQRAQLLEKAGAEVVAGNLEDHETLKAAANGMDAIFTMSTSYEAGPEAEVRQGSTMAQVAAQLGIRLIYSSAAGADRDTGIRHLEAKLRVEQQIARLGGPATILRPVAFMENTTAPWARARLRDGVLSLPIPSGRPVQHVAVADIAAFVRLALERPADFTGATVELAADELTGEQMATALTAASGHAVKYVEPKRESLPEYGGEDGVAMRDWFNRESFGVDIAALRASYPEIPWRDFTTWADEQNWNFLHNR
ncbi:NmrA/HSCARG family protein [Nonomuraea sp. NPDC002799]